MYKGINTLEQYLIEPYLETISNIVRYLYYDNVSEALSQFNSIKFDQKNMWQKGVYTALRGLIESFRRSNSKESLIEKAFKKMKPEEIETIINTLTKRLRMHFTDDFDRGYMITMIIILDSIIKIKERSS